MTSIDRSLHLLELLADADHAPTHGTLSRTLGIPKSTLSDILVSLQQNGYVGVVGRQYVPGIRLISLAHRIAASDGLRSVAKPVMDQLAGDTGETVILGALVGRQVTYIEQSPSPREIRYVATIGAARPIGTTASGRILAAFSPEVAASDNFPLLDDWSEPERARFAAILAEARERGYALNVEESVEGVSAIAVPVRRGGSSVIASLSVTGPAHRMLDMEVRIRPLLLAAAESIAVSTLRQEPLAGR